MILTTTVTSDWSRFGLPTAMITTCKTRCDSQLIVFPLGSFSSLPISSRPAWRSPRMIPLLVVKIRCRVSSFECVASTLSIVYIKCTVFAHPLGPHMGPDGHLPVLILLYLKERGPLPLPIFLIAYEPILHQISTLSMWSKSVTRTFNGRNARSRAPSTRVETDRTTSPSTRLF